jgi:hypothetical protein
MTLMDEVIQQIETVLDEEEYPATLGELVAIKRVLTALNQQYAPRAEHLMHPAAAMITNRFFPRVVYASLRDYERRRHAPALVRSVPSVSCDSM